MDRAVTNRRKITEVKSVCCYCGTGCGVVIETDGVHLLNVRGDPDHPVNRGQLCIKGQTLAAAHVRTGRATRPLIRPKRGAAFQPTDWDTALRLNAERFAQIIATHGPDAVAFYVSGQLLTEDYYLFNKLARGLVGTNNIDSNSRLCMSSAVTAYRPPWAVTLCPAATKTSISLTYTSWQAATLQSPIHPVPPDRGGQKPPS